MKTLHRAYSLQFLSLAVLLAAGLPAGCGRSQTGSAAQPPDAASWCSYKKMSARSGGNHPNYYNTECKEGKLSLDFAVTYGTDQGQLTLDLATGAISGARTQQSDKKDIAAKPPEQGGDYFDYQAHLETIASTLKTMIELAGEWENRGINTGKLNDALAYVKSLKAKAAALPGIDKLKLHDPRQMVLGWKNTVYFEYKVSAARDILVSLSKGPHIYASTRISAAAGVGTANATIELPLTAQGGNTASLIVTLMPQGAGRDGKLDEIVSPVTLENGDRIFNLYTENRAQGGYDDNDLYAGKENHFYTNWRIVRDRDLIVRLVDKSGKVWAEKRVSAKTGGDDSAHLTLFIPENTPGKADEYQLVMRIVAVGSSWDKMLTEQICDFNHRLTVKAVPIQRQSSEAFEINSREPGVLTAAIQDGKRVLSIRGGRGIGEATIRLNSSVWPEEVIIRAYLSGLESLRLSAGETTLAASVLSHSGNGVLLHLDRNMKEGPQLGKDSPYWMEIKACNADGKRATELPPKGGWFEMAVPKALLKGANELKVSWIDFYR
jgi:hypothetical protein